MSQTNGCGRAGVSGLLGARGVAFAAALLLMMSSFFVIGTASATALTPGPALLQADAVDSGHVDLAWTMVTSASQYTVYRDGVSILVANTLRTTDTAITPGSSHSYQVTATVSGAASGPSPTMSVAVPAVLDKQAPTSPTNLHTTSVGNTSASLAWSASSDDVGVIGYFVKLGPILYSLSEGSTSTNISYLKANTTYTFSVTALDASGKQSLPAQITLKTAVLGTSDTTAPAAPTLTATAYSANEVDLSWSLPSATDLTGFLVYQGTQLLENIPPNASIQTRALPVTGLTGQTAYTFSVQAYDAAGNVSTASAKSVTTLAASNVQVARGPYVQRVDAQSARVVWRTNIPASSNLSYSDGVNNFTVQDPVLRTDHSVLIGPLPSLARITYTLNYPTPKSGNFATCSGSPSNLALDAVGDMGGGSTPEKSIASLIAGDHPDLIAAMGDDVYPTGADKDYPARFFTPYTSPLAGSAFFTTFGNHEYYTPGAADSRRAWSQPGSKSSFSFDCSGVHIAVVDNFQPYGPGSAQYNWLANDLSTTTQPWKIVVMHLPPYSSSAYVTSPGKVGVLDPLFESTGVQLVLGGHSHNYERSKVINGVTYIVDGGGGNGLNAFSGTPPSWSAHRAAEYSYLRLKISPSQIQGTEVRQDGTTGDGFTIAGTATVLPDTVIDPPVPAAQTIQTSATFSFHSTQTPATFQCQLDGGTAATCTSPTTYSGLGEGSHTFSVQATAASGTDPTPATAAWIVDTTAPTAPALSATAPTSTRVNLVWTAATDANGIAGYDITRNSVPLTSVSGSVLSYSDTSVAASTPYSYQVVARDPAGNSASSNIVTLTTPAPSSSGPLLVQSAGTATSTGSTTSTVTLPASSTAGDLLVLSAGVYTGLTNPITSVTDSAGNIWTRIGAYAVSGHSSDGEIWYSPNANAVSSVIAHTGSATTMALEVQEFSGIATTGSLDVATGASNTGTTASSGSVTPTAANDLVVGFVAGHGNGEAISVTAPGYTTQPQQSTTGTGITSVETGFQVLTSASSQAMTGSFAQAMYWSSGVATFKAAGTATVLPDTVIDPPVPAAQTIQTSATFSFHSTQTPATFQCQLDGGTAATCTSPASYTVAEGSHTFSVQATAASGTDPTPATATWTVDTTAPTAPALSATAPTSTRVNLVWTAATDANGIAGYDITRNSVPLTSVSGSVLSYSDTSVAASTPYSYQVVARDPAGNSASSNTAPLTTPPPSSSGPLLVQAAGTATSTGSTTSTVTLPASSNAGDLLVLSAGVYAGLTNPITLVTDPAGNTWTRIGAYAVSGHNSDGEMWYSPNAKAVSSVTAHTSSATTMAVEVQEFSGIATTGSLDVATGASNTSTTAASGSVTPTAANDLVVGFVAGHGNGEPISVTATGYTTQTQQSTTGTGITSVVTGFQVLTSASSQAMTGSFAQAMYWSSGIATFKAAN